MATESFDLTIPEAEILLIGDKLIDTLREFVTYGLCRQNNRFERESLAEKFRELAGQALKDFPHLKLSHVGAKTIVTPGPRSESQFVEQSAGGFQSPR